MIGYLQGDIKRLNGSSCIVDVAGVGYLVEMPLRDCLKIQKNTPASCIWIYTHVREDQLKLFGFFSLIDKEMFEILLSVSGVGPKVALAILSTLSTYDIVRAVEMGRTEILTDVPE